MLERKRKRKRKNRGKARIRKRVRQSSTYGEKHQSDNHLEDRISQLPEGILVHILSLLTIKEAGRSSVLSHKWRDLWKFTAGLNFRASDSQFIGKQFRRERSKFVTWVNQVLKLHQRPSLDEFRVSFRFDVSESHYIDEWMKFWIKKRVKRLEFVVNSYTLSQECYRCFKSPSNLSSIKCLTSLSLAGVNVNGELIEYFLSNCPHLEQLRIRSSEQPVKLKVAGPSLQLKHLEILRCNGLESLEVCAPRLVTLKYLGGQIRLHIGNLPLLAELHVGRTGLSHEPSDSLVPFFGCFSHIETLELNFCLAMDFKPEILQVPELTNLKRLILEIFVGFSESLLSFTPLIEAAPSLLKFTLKLNAHCNMRGIPLAKNFTNHPHRCLKDVEMFGFTGARSDLELVLYLLQNAINLEKIVIDPYRHNLPISLDTKEIEEARKSAHRLEEKVPLGVKLFVL